MAIGRHTRPRNFSLRKSLNERVANYMMAGGHKYDDKPAISLYSGMVLDEFERLEWITRAEADRLSPKVTQREVKKIIMDNLATGYEPRNMLNQAFMQAPTYKRVPLTQIEPLDDAHAKWRGRVWGTKEKLRFKPTMVQLVAISQG